MGEHHDLTGHGDPLDRDIDALLQVEHSRDFVARVRVSVNAESIAPRVWLAARWMAVVASLVVLVAVVSLWDEPRASPIPRRAAAPEAVPLAPPEPIVIEPITIAPLLTADLELGEHQ